MPRAEIPEGVERWTIVHGRDDAEDEAILIRDLPKLYQHWLEQLKEELLAEATVEAVALVHRDMAEYPERFPTDGKWQARRLLEAALTSIPIEGERSTTSSAPKGSV